MTEMPSQLQSLIQSMQASIGPCVLISGFGFILLTMSNRMGRSIDRIRELKGILDVEPTDGKPGIQKQIAILLQRCHILQLAITLIICCIFSVSLNVLFLFLALKFQWPLGYVIEILFTLSLVFLMFALILFLLDIQKGLHSIKIELEDK
jgi:hypothetical protein